MAYKLKNSVIIEKDLTLERLNATVTTSIPTWVTTTSYKVGEVIEESNKIYKCILDHTAGTFTTDLALNWVEISAGVTSANLKDWTTATTYFIGDIVKNESRVYRATTAHTSGTFNTDRANWEVIVPLQAISPWSAATYYYEGETLNVSGRVFRCNTSHTSDGGNFGVDELTKWDRVDNISSSLDYQGSFYYYQGEQITNNKKIYRRIAAGASSLLFDITEQTNWELVGGGVATNIPNSPDSTLAPVFISNKPIGGNIGLPTTTVDINSVFSVTQTTSGQTLTLPNPTVTTGARLVTIQNSLTSTTSFTVYGQELQIGNSTDLLWNGSTWSKIGVDPTTQPLTSGRVNALLDLASTTHVNTDPGTKIPFTGTVYTNGMTVNAGGIIPSVSGRYRADWLCMAASTDFLADGIFHVVQNGVSVGQVSYNMNEASAVNQSAGFIDVNLVAGQEVSLHYRTRHTASDGIAWDRGSYFQLTQLPTAVAPVVDTVAEYGEVVQPSNIAFSATTDTDVMSFTLPTAGVWEVTYNVTSQINSSINGRGAWISDNSNVVIANTGSSAVSNPSGGTINAFLPLTQTARITTTGATTYKVRFRADTPGTLVANLSGVVGGISSILQNKVVYTKIAGQLPSTGTTVDYVNVYRTSDIAVAGQTAIVFNTVLSGNIPYNTSNGQFTLTAGKTYKLTGNVNLNQTSTALFTAWYDVTSGAYISPGARVSNGSSTTYGTNQGEIIFTPTVTTIVELRNNIGSAVTVAGAAIGSVNGVASQATIVQLGSTSNTVGTLPAVDQSSAGYFDIGNMRMQWGSTGSVANGSFITLPVPFANSNYAITLTPFASGTRMASVFSTTATTFQVSGWEVNSPVGGIAVNAKWIAIGQRP